MNSYFDKSNKVRNGGLTIVEVIFYVVVLIILLITVTNTFLTIRTAYQEMKYSSDLSNSAIVAMDRMQREIRNADIVDFSSTLGSSPGVLVMTGTDFSGAAQAIRFNVVNGALTLSRGSSVGTLAVVGPITGSLVTVTNLVFRTISTPRSNAVKIEMTIRANGINMQRSDKYYGTVILGGSY